MTKNYILPDPVIDKKEEKIVSDLTNKYKEIIEPSKAAKAIKKIGNHVPKKVKNTGSIIANKMTEQELYKQAMKIISSGYKSVEEQVSKYTISENMIIKEINKKIPNANIETIEEICLIRSYEISKIINRKKDLNMLYAGIEGGVTGTFSFIGLPFNIVFSLLLYFRAVQTIAMYYGYDVKNNDEELIIASNVFSNALSPGKNDVNNELGGVISKVMLFAKASVVKQTAKKSWTDMATHGGIPLLLTQMRALANKSAQKALEKAGKKSLEQTIFKDIFELLGRNMTLKNIAKSVPFISGTFGALIDYYQMKTVVKYADIFYHKRFIMEKQARIDMLIPDYIDIEISKSHHKNNE